MMMTIDIIKVAVIIVAADDMNETGHRIVEENESHHITPVADTITPPPPIPRIDIIATMTTTDETHQNIVLIEIETESEGLVADMKILTKIVERGTGTEITCHLVTTIAKMINGDTIMKTIGTPKMGIQR